MMNKSFFYCLVLLALSHVAYAQETDVLPYPVSSASDSADDINKLFPGFETIEPVAPLQWKGPKASFRIDPKTQKTLLDINGESFSPVFLSVNPQAINEKYGWDILLKEIDAASKHGTVVIDLMMANKSNAQIKILAEKIGARKVYFMLRFDSIITEENILSGDILKNTKNEEKPSQDYDVVNRAGNQWSKVPSRTTMDKQWITIQQAGLKNFLEDLNNSSIIDRIIGLRPTNLVTGEWFEVPAAYSSKSSLAMIEPWLMKQKPWDHPDLFYVGNYSQRESAMFTLWNQKISGEPDIKVPSVLERITPKTGKAFAVDDKGNGLSVVKYHQFSSQRIAWVQLQLAKTIKELTHSHALTLYNNGYLYALDSYNGSTHTELSSLLKSKWIDAVISPYSYDSHVSRSVGSALIAHGPVDSPLLTGKVWITEDDTRPAWEKDAFREISTEKEQMAVLSRNMITTLLHGNALYFLDLFNHGWFGGVDKYAASIDAFWARVQELQKIISTHQDNTNAIMPEVAIFIDDHSYSLYPDFGMDGKLSEKTSKNLLTNMISTISRAGAPVRYYLVSDLENPKLDVSSVKAAFFINTPLLTQKQRQAIQERLMNNKRVLYFQHAAGFFDEKLIYTPSLAALFTANTSLKTIENSAFGKLTITDKKSYKLAYSPKGITKEQVKKVLSAASVHSYAQNAVIDGAGSLLMVHKIGGTVPITFKNEGSISDITSKEQVLCKQCKSVTLNFTQPDTKILYFKPFVSQNNKTLK